MDLYISVSVNQPQWKGCVGMVNPVDNNSAIVIATAISLSEAVIKEVSDQEYTDMLNGSVVSSEMLSQMIASSMQKRLSQSLKYSPEEK